jgi:hypothetical protein
MSLNYNAYLSLAFGVLAAADFVVLVAAGAAFFTDFLGTSALG